MSSNIPIYFLLMALLWANDLKIAVQYSKSPGFYLFHSYDDDTLIRTRKADVPTGGFTHMSFDVNALESSRIPPYWISKAACNSTLNVYREMINVLTLHLTYQVNDYHRDMMTNTKLMDVAAYNPKLIETSKLDTGVSFGDCRRMRFEGFELKRTCSLYISDCVSEPPSKLAMIRSEKESKTLLGTLGNFLCFSCDASKRII